MGMLRPFRVRLAGEMTPGWGVGLSIIMATLWSWNRGGPMAEPSYEELKAQLAELQKQSGNRRTGSLDFRVGEKGGVSVYGLGRFPVTLYYEQWIRLLDTAKELREFLEENKASGKLKLKESNAAASGR